MMAVSPADAKPPRTAIEGAYCSFGANYYKLTEASCCCVFVYLFESIF